MVQINFAGKEIMTKVVYYGPALCGKTTNLQKLHQITDPQGETKLFSINTDKDRTLFFDLLPLNIGKVHGYNIKLQVFTVPGQVHYGSTRRAVLSGADAVVFVADSQHSMMDANIESLRDLGVNLQLNGLDIESLPLVLQYNKRDLAAVSPLGELEKQLNDTGHQSFEAIALNGKGVLETFVAVVKEMMTQIVEKYRLNRGNKKVDITGQLVQALEAFKETSVEDTNPVDMRKLLLTFEQPSERIVPEWGASEEDSANDTLPGAMSNNELIERAVAANMELANIYVQLDESKKQVETKVKQLKSVTRIGEAITSILELEKLLSTVGRLLGEHAGDSICISLVEGRPLDLKPRINYKITKDPIFQLRAEKGKTLAHLLAHQRRPVIVSSASNENWYHLINSKFPCIQGLLSVPLMSHRRLLGLINIMTTDTQRRFDEEDIKFYGATAKFLSTAIENARLYGMVSVLNRNLEVKVEEIRHLNESARQSVKLKTIELTQANQALTKANAMLQKRNESKKLLFKRVFDLVPAVIVLTHDFLEKGNQDRVEKAVYQYVLVCLNSFLQLQANQSQLSPKLLNIAKTMIQVIRLHKSLLRDQKIRVMTKLEKTLPFQTDPIAIRMVFSLNLLFGMAFSQRKEIRVWGENSKKAIAVCIRNRYEKSKAAAIQTAFDRKYDKLNPTLPSLVFEISKAILTMAGGSFELKSHTIEKSRSSDYLITRFVFSKGASV